jgi:hypothetical protein
MTTVEQLKGLYIKLGGLLEDLKDCNTDALVIKKIDEIVGDTPKILVFPESQSTQIFNETVSNMQSSDFGIFDKCFVGTVKKLTSGDLPEYWGEGNFMAVKFVITDPNITYENVKVGIKDLVTLDGDLNAAIKIEDKTLPFKVVVDDGKNTIIYKYNLNALVLED